MPHLVSISLEDGAVTELQEIGEAMQYRVASVAFDLYWAELLLGHGARPELAERWRELEDQAGPEASKSVIPLIYFHSIDDFDAARSRHAVEAEWYRVRGEEGWVAERLAHLGFVEFRAGRWDLAEQLVEDAPGSVDDALPLSLPRRRGTRQDQTCPYDAAAFDR